MRHLSGWEKETIINFNESEDVAHIFTYNPAWQRHLEGKLGLKPVMDNGYGGKEYLIENKRRIRPPRVPVRLSEKAKQARAKRLAGARPQAVRPGSPQARVSAKTP